MNHREIITQKIKQLLREIDESSPEKKKKLGWTEASFIILAVALALQAIATTTAINTRAPMYVGMDPYGNHVVTVPERPLTGKVYREAYNAPGTKVIPAQDELKERTALEFRF